MSRSNLSGAGLPGAEFTFKAIAIGVALGIVFGAANAYMGLLVGMTISASIPAAVMTLAIFRIFRVRGTILEANLAKTVAAASTSLATGAIFTVPALYLWGLRPSLLQVTLLCLLGGVFGALAMIPLRRLLTETCADELPFPEGAACAEVLKVSFAGQGGGGWIFYGIGIAVLCKLLITLVPVLPGEIGARLPLLPKAYVGVMVAPAMVGIGYILGYKRSAVIVSGSVLASLVLIPLIAHFGGQLRQPLAPETTRLIADLSVTEIWSSYVKYIGAGAVALAGIFAVGQTLPTIFGSLRKVGGDLLRRSPATVQAAARDRDLPGWVIATGLLLVVATTALVPAVFGAGMGLGQRLVCAGGMGLCAGLFVTVTARIVGLVGVSSQPTSGITLLTLMVLSALFVACGWVDPAAMAGVMTVGTIVAIAVSQGGNISQDLKTGSLIGATPLRMQVGMLIGAASSCWAVAATILLLGAVYRFGSPELPAPQATLMKTVVEGFLSGRLPWPLVLSGAGITLPMLLCGVPGLSFAIGVYLPLASMAAIYLGGCVRALSERRARGREALPGQQDLGVLAASGLVAGEGLAGVLIAALKAARIAPGRSQALLQGGTGILAGLLVLALVCGFLLRSARASSASS
jgi:putative OPT family oligopeptide transporter